MSSNRIRGGLAIGAVVAVAVVGAVSVADAGPPARDLNGNFAVLDVDLSPPQASTTAKRRGVALDIHYFAGNDKNGARVPYDGDITLRLPKSMVSNAAQFPSKCPLPATTEELGDDSRCPVKSRVGQGSVELDARPGFQGVLGGAVTAYNGTANGSRPTLLLVIHAHMGDSEFRDEIDLEYSRDPTGPFERKFATIHPVADPSAGLAAIRTLDLTIPNQAVKRTVNGKKRRIHLFETPRTCKKPWEFSLQVANEAGDASITASDSVGCVKSSSP